MSRPRTTATAALVVSLALVLGAGGALAQGGAATDDATTIDDTTDELLPIESVLPGLAPIGPIRSPLELCTAAGGTLAEGADCELESGPLLSRAIGGILGDDAVGSIVRASVPPLTGLGAAAADMPGIERVAFIDDVAVARKARQALKKLARRKGTTVIDARKTKWRDIGVVELVLEPGFPDLSDRGLEWVVRVRSGDRTRDFGRIDRKEVVADARGRKQDGLAVLADGSITLAIPGGVADPFTVELAYSTGEQVVGQFVPGPGGSEARIPADGAFPAVLECAEVVAGIDFDSSTDGRRYDLLLYDMLFRTNVIPEWVDPEALSLDIRLTPAGSRARSSEAVEFVDQSVRSGVRPAIAVNLDLTEQALTGEQGYVLGERPFDLFDMVATIDTMMLEDHDPDAAAELLAEAGWLDEDGDGAFVRDVRDIVEEITRQAGAEHVSRPLFYGDPGCGRDAHYLSVAGICEVPTAPGQPVWSEWIGEDPTTLELRSGLFPGDLPGCTLLAQDDRLVGVFGASPDHGQDEPFDPAWIEWSAQLECEVQDLSASVDLDAPLHVATCPASGFEIWADRESGAWAYALLPEADLTPAGAQQFIRTFSERDMDGDGVADRYDDDLDGDGISDFIDGDDDGDLIPDDADFNPRDPRQSLSPARQESLRLLVEDTLGADYP